MKTLLLSILLVFTTSFGFSQTQQYELQCEMTVEEIQLSQSYNIDHYKQEETYSIVITLFDQFNLLYGKLNDDLSSDVSEHIEIIQVSIQSAEALGMNYDMFSEDLIFIETLN